MLPTLAQIERKLNHSVQQYNDQQNNIETRQHKKSYPKQFNLGGYRANYDELIRAEQIFDQKLEFQARQHLKQDNNQTDIQNPQFEDFFDFSQTPRIYKVRSTFNPLQKLQLDPENSKNFYNRNRIQTIQDQPDNYQQESRPKSTNKAYYNYQNYLDSRDFTNQTTIVDSSYQARDQRFYDQSDSSFSTTQSNIFSSLRKIYQKHKICSSYINYFETITESIQLDQRQMLVISQELDKIQGQKSAQQKCIGIINARQNCLLTLQSEINNWTANQQTIGAASEFNSTPIVGNTYQSSNISQGDESRDSGNIYQNQHFNQQEYLDSCARLLADLRILTVTATQSITDWREYLIGLNPAFFELTANEKDFQNQSQIELKYTMLTFFYNNENYLLKMRVDTHFLQKTILVRYLPFSVKYDPFLVYPSKNFPQIELQEQKSLENFCQISKDLRQRIQVCEKIMVDEFLAQKFLDQEKHSIQQKRFTKHLSEVLPNTELEPYQKQVVDDYIAKSLKNSQLKRKILKNESYLLSSGQENFQQKLLKNEKGIYLQFKAENTTQPLTGDEQQEWFRPKALYRNQSQITARKSQERENSALGRVKCESCWENSQKGKNTNKNQIQPHNDFENTSCTHSRQASVNEADQSSSENQENYKNSKINEDLKSIASSEKGLENPTTKNKQHIAKISPIISLYQNHKKNPTISKNTNLTQKPDYDQSPVQIESDMSNAPTLAFPTIIPTDIQIKDTDASTNKDDYQKSGKKIKQTSEFLKNTPIQNEKLKKKSNSAVSEERSGIDSRLQNHEPDTVSKVNGLTTVDQNNFNIDSLGPIIDEYMMKQYPKQEKSRGTSEFRPSGLINNDFPISEQSSFVLPSQTRNSVDTFGSNLNFQYCSIKEENIVEYLEDYFSKIPNLFFNYFTSDPRIMLTRLREEINFHLVEIYHQIPFNLNSSGFSAESASGAAVLKEEQQLIGCAVITIEDEIQEPRRAVCEHFSTLLIENFETTLLKLIDFTFNNDPSDEFALCVYFDRQGDHETYDSNPFQQYQEKLHQMGFRWNTLKKDISDKQYIKQYCFERPSLLQTDSLPFVSQPFHQSNFQVDLSMMIAQDVLSEFEGPVLNESNQKQYDQKVLSSHEPDQSLISNLPNHLARELAKKNDLTALFSFMVASMFSQAFIEELLSYKLKPQVNTIINCVSTMKKNQYTPDTFDISEHISIEIANKLLSMKNHHMYNLKDAPYKKNQVNLGVFTEGFNFPTFHTHPLNIGTQKYHHFRVKPLESNKDQFWSLQSEIYSQSLLLVPSQDSSNYIFLLQADQFVQSKEKNDIFLFMQYYLENIVEKEVNKKEVWIPMFKKMDLNMKNLEFTSIFEGRKIFSNLEISLNHKEFLKGNMLLTSPNIEDSIVFTPPFIIGVLNIELDQILSNFPIFSFLIQTEDLLQVEQVI